MAQLGPELGAVRSAQAAQEQLQSGANELGVGQSLGVSRDLRRSVEAQGMELKPGRMDETRSPGVLGAHPSPAFSLLWSWWVTGGSGQCTRLLPLPSPHPHPALCIPHSPQLTPSLFPAQLRMHCTFDISFPSFQPWEPPVLPVFGVSVLSLDLSFPIHTIEVNSH